jgi:predicted methyltransferase
LQAVDGPVLEIFRACEALKGRQWLVFRQGKIRLGALPAELRRAFRVDFHSVLRRFSRIAATMPRATTMFFQEPMLPEDVVARVRFLWERGDLFQRDILVLGDDDLFSIAAGLTGLPRRIVVGEIDERLVRFLDQVAAREQLPLEVFQYDVAEPLPPRLRRQFDVFVMDPVETITGFSAWLSRGLAAVGHPGAIYFGLTELECPPKIWQRFEQLIVGSGLVITDIIRDFSRYQNVSLADPEKWTRCKLVQKAPFPAEPAESLYWYRSSFVRAITVRIPSVPVRGRVPTGRSFYENTYTVTLD